MRDIGAEIRRSSETFRSVVWPHLGKHLGGGELIPTETVMDSAFARLLDQLGMTDAWRVKHGEGVQALASRVQYTSKPWNTWTIRYSLPSGNTTEFHKLTRSIDWHLPSYIIQAYVDNNALLSVAAIQTRDLQALLRAGVYHNDRRPNPDGTTFVYVRWHEAEAQGISIVRIDDSDDGQLRLI